MAEARKDANLVNTLLGVSNADGVTPVVLWADPTTHRLLTTPGAGSGATTALDNLSSVAINAALVLATSDAFALGSATKMWSDLFLASGAVINFNNGDMTITHSADTITFAGGTVALGVATATTINGLTITSSTGTLTIAALKTLIVSNSITITATDGATLAIGAGGTLGTGAYATIALYATLASPTFTGTVILPKTVEIQDTTGDHQYVLAVSELAADRTITLPLLAASDTFVFADFIQTLTNKRITQRVVTTTDDATSVINVDTTDVYELSAVANNTEFTTTGTPTDGQKLIVRYKDAGVSKTLTWTFATAIGVTLPTATTVSKWGYVGLIYNSAAAQWHAVAVTTQA